MKSEKKKESSFSKRNTFFFKTGFIKWVTKIKTGKTQERDRFKGSTPAWK